MENSGAQVRALRELLQLTQEQVAERAGIERTVVVKVEAGVNKLSSFNARTAMARGLGLTIEQLTDLISGDLTPSVAAEHSALRAKGAA